MSVDTSQMSHPTPRITRPPVTLPEHDKQRVAGRVHVLVRALTNSSVTLPSLMLPQSGALTPELAGQEVLH